MGGADKVMNWSSYSSSALDAPSSLSSDVVLHEYLLVGSWEGVERLPRGNHAHVNSLRWVLRDSINGGNA